MKKLKLILPIFLLLMFIPFIVNAETCDIDKISIDTITKENVTGNTTEIDEATASGKNINLNLSMSEVGDSIEYKVVVKNESNDDYELDNTSFNLSSDYINYNITSDDDSNIVKANSNKTVYLKVEYKNEVSDDLFESGTYNDNQTMTVQLSTRDTISVPDMIKNPNTGNYAIFIILIILIVSGISFIVLRKKQCVKFMILIIGTVIIIPLSVYALCKCEINIESNITIEEKMTCIGFNNDNSWKDIIETIKSNNTSCMNVGDTKEIDMGDFGIHTIRISNMSTPDECNQEDFSQTACGFVLEFEDIILWHNMNNTNTNVGGWPASDLRLYINETIYDSIPNELKNAILNTKVISGHGYTDGENNFISVDKLYLLSPKEVQYDTRFDSAADNTRVLDYYKTDSDSKRIKYNSKGYPAYWWLRTAYYSKYDTQDWNRVYNSDTQYNYAAISSCGVSPALRIGS